MSETLLISKTDIASIKQIPSTIKVERVNPYILEAQRFDLQEAIGYALYNDLLLQYGSENLSITHTPPTVAFNNGELVNGKNGVNTVATGIMVSDTDDVLVLSTLTGDWDDAETLAGDDSGALANISTLTYGKYYRLMNGDDYIDPLGYRVNFLGLKMAIAYWAYARFIENQQDTVTDIGFVTKENDYSASVEAKRIANRITQARSAAFACFATVKKYLNDKNNGALTYSLWASFLGSDRKKSTAVRTTTIDRERSGYVRKKSSDSGFSSSISTGLSRMQIVTTLNGVAYTIPQLRGKTIVSVQYENMVLTPAQWTLVLSTFTITDPDMQTGVILAGKFLNILYES